jgi:Protein of unknown function (DUF3759)
LLELVSVVIAITLLRNHLEADVFLFLPLASFEAIKAWEDHQRREGKTVSHGFAKELLAGFAGAEIDKL